LVTHVIATRRRSICDISEAICNSGTITLAS
jgi:hypothetical protein